jgi:RpiR family carbohydrate utilization transcriptional regulator
MPENEILLLKIRGLLPSLNPALKKIALFILNNPQEVKLLRIKDLASRCGVAEATITRFVKTIGLGSFQELKINIAEITTEKRVAEEIVYDDVTRSDSIKSLIDKIIAINSKALNDTRKLINIKEIERAIKAIRRAHQIDIYGAGGSYITAENARMRFYRIGKRCIIYNDPNQQAVSASLLTPEDLAIGICNSGRTVSTVNALKAAKKSGATTICITNFDQSPITRYADIRLFTSTQDSAFFQESMVSRVAQMIIIDILYAGLAIQTFDDSIQKIEKSSRSLRNVLL